MRITLLKFTFLLGILLGWIGMSNAQSCTLEVNQTNGKQSLANSISVWFTPLILNPSQAFDSIQLSKQTQHCTAEMSQGFSNNFYWISFNIFNSNVADSLFVIELDNPHIDTCELYLYGADSSFLRIGLAGDRMPFFQRTYANRRIVFPINIPPNSTHCFLLKVDKRNASVSYPLNVIRLADFEKSEQRHTLFFMFYFGGVIFVSLFSLTIGLLLRNYRMLSYGVYAGSMGFYLFIALGFAFQFIYPQSDSLNNSLRSQAMVITLFTFVWFSTFFLKLNETNRSLHRFFITVSIFLALVSVLSFAFEAFFFQHIVFFLNLIYISIFIVSPVILYAAFKSYHSNPYLIRAYLIAFLAILLGTLINTFVEYGLIEERMVPLNPILVGSMLELFILSWAFIIEIKHINDRKNILLQESLRQQKELINAYVRGTEEEGSRISKELHDNIGSRLALLKNQIDYMEFDKAKIKAQVNDIFMDVRLISDELSPNKIALLGIIPSIKELFNQLVNSTDIKVNFYAQEKVEISVENAIHIYRVFQEIIQNILKHSQATTVDCQVLKEDNGAIVFVVDDNGVGYDSASHNYQFSSGLQNIRFRIEAINGKIDISSKPNAGTHIMIWCG